MSDEEVSEFYYDLTNIGSDNKDRLFDIMKIIKAEIKPEKENFSTDGLCMILSNNIGIALKEANIDFRVINTLDLGSTYEHVSIVAFYKTTKINYVLIDTAFNQFVREEGLELKAFKEWPSDILARDEEGKELLENLVNMGCGMIDNSSFNKYLRIFTNKDFTFDLNNLIALDLDDEYAKNHL